MKDQLTPQEWSALRERYGALLDQREALTKAADQYKRAIWSAGATLEEAVAAYNATLSEVRTLLVALQTSIATDLNGASAAFQETPEGYAIQRWLECVGEAVDILRGLTPTVCAPVEVDLVCSDDHLEAINAIPFGAIQGAQP